MVVLGVIGVVAALTMPTLLTNVNERVNSHRQANIAYKITQATDKMKALGLLNGSYSSTDAFVDELQKHLKIAKRCDANHIADCWPTDKVITSDGKEFVVSKAKKGRHLQLAGNKSDNVGLVLADGASIILTYNQDSQGIDESDSIVADKKALPVGFGKSQDFAYTTNTTGAIDFVMDVNGKKGPNSETINNKYHDIRSFKAARFSKGCAGTEVAGIGCVVNLGTSYDCLARGTDEQKKWDPNLHSNYSYSCWGGAKKACDDIGMSLPDIDGLKSIYNKKGGYPDLHGYGNFWSSTEVSPYYAYMINFDSNGNASNRHKMHQINVFCILD